MAMAWMKDALISVRLFTIVLTDGADA
ncbi:hypothetical protein MED297_09031 [Reinekea sp. MED297]|uniref:Uncharacterized protein n=1 Tax=Reinekea blandensis MED297 TaxID=314283 RepID=A4BGJ0_9GAMM|nr:hypothetical protein MED297_09031 [Reinekea sp. MED297] [Reinekea blandensis MED297]